MAEEEHTGTRLSLELTPVGRAKLAKLIAASREIEERIELFLHAYLAAHGIEEGTVEEIDIENGILIVREGNEHDRPAHHSPHAESA